MKACCKTMEWQLTNACKQHGIDCPDKVIVIDKNTKHLYLQGRNGTYILNFCPWCGLEVLKNREMILLAGVY